MMILIIILLLAVYMDLKSFQISNRIILFGYFSGIFYQVILQILHLNTKPFYVYPLAGILIIFLLQPIYRMKAIGGGDVKLFSVCAIYTGLIRTGSIIIYALFAGAIISIIFLAYRRLFQNHKLNNLKNKREKLVIHFSIPILAGVIAESLWGGII